MSGISAVQRLRGVFSFRNAISAEQISVPETEAHGAADFFRRAGVRAVNFGSRHPNIGMYGIVSGGTGVASAVASGLSSAAVAAVVGGAIGGAMSCASVAAIFNAVGFLANKS